MVLTPTFLNCTWCGFFCFIYLNLSQLLRLLPTNVHYLCLYLRAHLGSSATNARKVSSWYDHAVWWKVGVWIVSFAIEDCLRDKRSSFYKEACCFASIFLCTYCALRVWFILLSCTFESVRLVLFMLNILAEYDSLNKVLWWFLFKELRLHTWVIYVMHT